MKVIACTGGKGGTGKSTFSLLLASKLARNARVLLCDLDVECPNLHLLFGKKLKNRKLIHLPYPKLEKDKCIKCGACSSVCKENAIFFSRGSYPLFFPELCNSCMACFLVCRQRAIRKARRVVGYHFTTRVSDRLWLITGKSALRFGETGIVVRRVKERAVELAKKIRADYLIVDTAPGTHCNVIQALLGCDKIYVVTEPTPLGAHDLKLILKLIQKLNIPAGIVLNKQGIGDESQIKAIAKMFKLEIEERIPYSKSIIDAYSQSKLSELSSLIGASL